MKYLVNGELADLEAAPDVEIFKGTNCLYVRTVEGTHTAVSVRVGGKTVVSYKGRVYEIEKLGAVRKGGVKGSGEFRAPMPGVIVSINTAQGETVKKGQKLLVLEAMKTQQPIQAPFDGRVMQLQVIEGQQVAEGDLLILVESSE